MSHSKISLQSRADPDDHFKKSFNKWRIRKLTVLTFPLENIASLVDGIAMSILKLTGPKKAER